MTQLDILMKELEQLRAETPKFQRGLTMTKYTPLQWHNERLLKQHLSEIDFLCQRIANLKRAMGINNQK